MNSDPNQDQNFAQRHTVQDSVRDSALGKNSEYPRSYTPSLLHAIARAESRAGLALEDDILPFKGLDVWNAYELSWLDNRGKPQCAIAEFQIPCTSPALVESKSFKLYLASLNGTQFSSAHEVRQTLEMDLSVTVKAPVAVKLQALTQSRGSNGGAGFGTMPGDCLDDLSVDITFYQPESMILQVLRGQAISESLHSHLFRSLCPVTGQPDWASVGIQYTGQPIERESLLKYLVSYRQHAAFHEHCVEQIFMDIWQLAHPQKLTVFARFLRRGGLDINPVRSSTGHVPENVRLLRQ